MAKGFDKGMPEILVISSYPPRECGIATFSQDLIKALDNKFYQSFLFKLCALESGPERRDYPPEVKFVLDTTDPQAYDSLTKAINLDNRIKVVLLQHEFGFFEDIPESHFLDFLHNIKKPLILAFHTVLPKPDPSWKKKVSDIVLACDAIVVMTKNAAEILNKVYGIPMEKISVIAHGIHLVPHLDKTILRQKYGLGERKILSTFGLISSGKSIETTLEALPGIITEHPTALFLVIGKTHPSVAKHEGEQYRRFLEAKVAELSLENHVKFINAYLPLNELLEYLQLTDIYLFTSKDPHQAVSGTFSYAMSCGCAIISTPIPHTQEVLREEAGILIDFQNSPQLTTAVNHLLGDRALRKKLIHNGLQCAIKAAWENTAIAYARLFKSLISGEIVLRYAFPEINLGHIREMTRDFGMVQFSKINKPDLDSGYTLDDNARAMIAMCMHNELFEGQRDLVYIKTYLDFIEHCQQPDGSFLNYVNADKVFTEQNQEANLEDANGRAVWALGYLISKQGSLPFELIQQAKSVLKRSLPHIETIHSIRAIAFAIKGLHYALSAAPSWQYQRLLEIFANRLAQMYRNESADGWNWFESHLTYGNSTVPEAMLCAYLTTDKPLYKNIARQSFDFLLQHPFSEEEIKVAPNKGWMQKGQGRAQHGERPIEVAYAILALQLFYEVFNEKHYKKEMETAFNWFLGQNHLDQIIYNPCTGGCYDGLEETHVNMNQGAESTLGYLMARLAIEKSFNNHDTNLHSVGIQKTVGKMRNMEVMLQ